MFGTFQVGVTSPPATKTGEVIAFGIPVKFQHSSPRSLCDRVLIAGLLLLLLLFLDPNSGGERVRIELDGLEAIVKTASKAKFFVEFHSACLEGAVCVCKTKKPKPNSPEADPPSRTLII